MLIDRKDLDMTMYTMSTKDIDEAMLAIKSGQISLFIYEWEHAMRSAEKHESGRLYDAMNNPYPIEAVRELWQNMKEEHELCEVLK